MNWSNLGFDFYNTGAFNIRYTYKEGKWSAPEMTTSEILNIHMSALCLHYGLEAFEGLKAFRGADERIRVFRPTANAARMANGAKKLCLPVVPEEMFVEACIEVVRKNEDKVPPYSSGATLYIRPLLIGTDPRLGVRPSDEAMFVVFVSPIGPYFAGGINPIKVIVDRDQDRSAPKGTGDVKVGGNYASSMMSYSAAHNNGYAAVLYTDSVEHKYIEECGAANFIAIRDHAYITPDSPSILPSITNNSLQILASDFGFDIEKRRVSVEELKTFDEAGACGTGAVISPIGQIFDPLDNTTVYYGNECGKVSRLLYDTLHDIQYGRTEDKYGWNVLI